MADEAQLTDDDHAADEDQSVHILTDPVQEMTCTECETPLDVSELESFTEIECPTCNKPQTVPARLGPFLLLKLLGTGGMGAVYHAVDESLGRHVAVKVMLKSFAEDTESVETLRREARMAATLNHPNIVQIYSFGTEKGQPYIVMELVSGQKLDELIARGKPLDVGLVMRIAIGVAQGLKAAEETGLVHGDIKPENILLDKEGIPKVVDFGLAGFAHTTDSEGGIWGSPYYIAPEKLQKQAADARSDIYSLGATLYHALAGKPPFDGATPIEVVKARLHAPAPPLTKQETGPLASANTVLMRMLQLEPSMRHPGYSSVISDMKRVFQEAKKKGSGNYGLATGKVLLTKKEKKRTGNIGTTAAAPVRRAKPNSPKLKATTASGTKARGSQSKSATRPSSRKLKATRASGTKARDSESKSSSRPSTAPLFVTAIIVIVLLVAGIGTTVHFSTKRANQAKVKAILQSIDDAMEQRVAAASGDISDTKSRKAKALKDKQEYEKGLNLRSAQLADEAVKMLMEADNKAKFLATTIEKVKDLGRTAKRAKTPQEAQSYYNKMKALLKESASIESSLHGLLQRATTKLRKAAALAKPAP